MTTIVLNEESSRVAIGDILASATGRVVEIKDQQGTVVAELVLHRPAEGNGADSAAAWAESEIEDIRRRRAADRSKDITTAELLRRAEEAVAGNKS